ncbi:MAG TPA: response regulator [Pyrinomonadaceae bacterium]|jgi:two-component system LytT family response regulator
MNDSPAKIHVLVVDDEPLARRGIRQQLKNAPDIEIVGEAGNGQEATLLIEKHKPDLVFLDIQMPLADGFSVIEKIGLPNLPEIVFVTAFDEHAIRAFEINALDYLLKPIAPERFQKTLERVREKLKNRQSDRIDEKLSALLQSLKRTESNAENTFLERVVIKDAGRIFFVEANEVVWISSEGNYVRLHTTCHGTHLLRETMDALESKLDPHRFLRLRRSTIVRIAEIKELHPLFNGEYVILLKDNTRLSSSRRYRKNLAVLLRS